MDWQDAQIWSGLWELAYFLNLLLPLGASAYREELPFDDDRMIGWYSDALAEAGVSLPKSVFDKALLSARVWHPIQHWIRQYSQAARSLTPTTDLRAEYPSAVRFLAATFDRWEDDTRILLGA